MEDGIANVDAVGAKVRDAFTKFPNWRHSETELRELRNLVTFAIYAAEDDMAKVVATVDSLFNVLQRS